MDTKERKPFTRAKEIRQSLNAAKITELTAGRNSLTNAFEKLDPSSEAIGEERGFDAFERVLLVSGLTPRSVPEYDVRASSLKDVESVFGNATTEDGQVSRAIVREIIVRAYKKFNRQNRSALGTSQDAVLGTFLNPYVFPATINLPKLEPAIKLADVVAVTEGITRDYVKPFYMKDIAETEEVRARIAEGAEVPAIEITNEERLINLKKAGIRLDFTYETIRQSPIDQIAYVFQRIAIRVDARKVDKVITTLINGDGNSGTAATNYTLTGLDPATTAGNLTWKAWLAFKKKFKNPFVLTHVFGQEQNTLALELLNPFLANSGGQAFNPYFSQMNDKSGGVVKIGDVDTVPSNLIVGIDARVAVKRWYEIGADIREIDTWIREQKKSFVMTETEAYQVDEPLAVRTLQLNA